MARKTQSTRFTIPVLLKEFQTPRGPESRAHIHGRWQPVGQAIRLVGAPVVPGRRDFPWHYPVGLHGDADRTHGLGRLHDLARRWDASLHALDFDVAIGKKIEGRLTQADRGSTWQLDLRYTDQALSDELLGVLNEVLEERNLGAARHIAEAGAWPDALAAAVDRIPQYRHMRLVIFWIADLVDGEVIVDRKSHVALLRRADGVSPGDSTRPLPVRAHLFTPQVKRPSAR